MAYTQFLDHIPVWVLFIVTTVVFSIAVELGFRAGRLKNPHMAKEQNPQVNTIMGASLGLLAFFLAFTFNMATSRYDARKQLVLDEAHGIGQRALGRITPGRSGIHGAEEETRRCPNH